MKERPRRPAGPKSKRERVVSAAAKLFLGEGYGTTGMDAIAKEAGVSKATVYSYYEDKATLFADVMLRMCEDLGGHDVEALVHESPDATLKAVALFGVRRLLETLDRSMLQRVVGESDEFPELGRKFWSTGPGKLEEFVTQYLTEAAHRGVLVVADPARVAARFVGQATGMYLLPLLVGARQRPSEAEIGRDLDELVAAVLAPLRPGRAGA